MAQGARDEVNAAAETVPVEAVSDGTGSDAGPPLRSARPTRPVARAGAQTGGSGVQERMQALVAREERAKFRKRLRAVLRIGVPIYLAFGLLDVVAVLRGQGPWWVFLVGRAVPVAWCGLVELHLRRRREPPIRLLRFYETTVFTLTVACLGMMYAVDGGWNSAKIPIASLILMAHAIMLGSHWRRSALPVIGMALAMPLSLLGCSAAMPALRAQLVDPDAMAEFLLLYAPIVGAAAIALAAGHSVWQLRNELAEAKSIGRYRLRRRIAAGGMGEIWAAYHAGLRRDVAVKLIQPGIGQDAVAIERFEREVQALAELTHPNTIRVFDYGATETGVWYYAMELLEARDLQSLVTAEGPLGPERAARLVAQAAGALGEAHERGIVHRDVKPANFLLVRPGQGGEFVKLIDFGIAKLGDTSGLTRTGMVMGTPGYIAPEVITGGEATPRADVYALGMVLYFLLAGGEPYEGSTPMAIVQQALEQDPPPLREARDDVPPALEAVVLRCLARDPLRRYADGAALAEALASARRAP
jgi:serine/threonine-protein kinase